MSNSNNIYNFEEAKMKKNNDNKLGPEITKHDIGERLFQLIRPYYKGISHDPDEPPAFRRSLKASEVEELLFGIHKIIFSLKLEEKQKELAEEAKQEAIVNGNGNHNGNGGT